MRHLTRPLLSSLQVLPILESLHSVYGPISVIHFDAHIDTWNPKRYMGSLSPQADINHGTFFWHAYEKGFIKPGANIHAGIRTRFSVSLRDRPGRSFTIGAEHEALFLGPGRSAGRRDGRV
jgi:arginase family enzyme